MEQLSFEDLGEMVPKRKQFTFVGSTEKSVSLDPEEFRGQSVISITAGIMQILASIAPDVSFFEQDIVEAANELSDRDR